MAVPLGGPRPAGTYRVLIAPESGLADREGNPRAPDGQPLSLGEYEVTAPSPEPPIDVVTATLDEPASGTVLTVSPEALVVSFSAPINPDTLGPAFALVALDVDGNVAGWEVLEAGILDPAGTRTAVPLNGPLSPGSYQVLIVPDSG